MVDLHEDADILDMVMEGKFDKAKNFVVVFVGTKKVLIGNVYINKKQINRII